ncbi:MAG: hypothetical protein HKL90_08015 [Elusimicrobia bacterium]|nr:hypothetical protein [Elusimicrobiota bacterium]
MTAEIFFNRMSIVVSLTGLIWFFYGPWQRLMVDIARHSLFEIRDALFLMGADGQLDFGSTEYREVRENFNRSIRFAHVVTFRRLLASMIFLSSRPATPMRISEILHRIPNEPVRHSIERKWRRSTGVLALTILLRSPSMMLLFAITFPFMIIAFILDPHRVAAVDHSIKRSIEHDMELQPCLVGSSI